jgi:superfamily II DNA or RNA helicase/HKD family nuclease
VKSEIAATASYEPPIAAGIYERLITAELHKRLARQPDADIVPLPVGAQSLLARYVGAALGRALDAWREDATFLEQVQLCNSLLDTIADVGPRGAILPSDRLVLPPTLLTGIPRTRAGLYEPEQIARPRTPITEDTLLVNAPHEPQLAGELSSEMASADRVDLMCAFIVWSGLRVLRDGLQALSDRGGSIRVITTTYTGITDPKALDELARMGADVRVSYDIRSTRLHAKAWLFHRESGFSTAYIGSSNLTRTAIHDGLEWNVRLAEARSPELVERFRSAFDTYWADPHLLPYDRDRFAEAINRIRDSSTVDFTPFDVVPYEYQRAMLDGLTAERERHDSWRNLVVSATGTGKTVLSALDYRRTALAWRGASLLFVAHRREILDQSRATFRHVLRDGAFGELLVAGERPAIGRHVFASIQSLAQADLESLNPASYDVVIVDEFHHAAAPTYRRLLERLNPRLLLGLTATPERADGLDILQWFNGRIAVELRLWEALDQGLLCPFQYFGVSDDVDLRQIEWKRSGYDTASLSAVYTGNDARLTKVLAALERIVSAPRGMRALGFCVSVEHANYMADRFRTAGIAAQSLTGVASAEDRSAAIRLLRDGTLQILFTVDLFNEGVDIPEIDTILLLRPTESATVFLQQLGRGLRLAEGKSGLTVLDFIGQQRREFRFGDRFMALTGVPRSQLAAAVDAQFPYLPAGCHIELDRVAREIILENVKAAVSSRRPLLVQEMRRGGDVGMGEFLAATARPPEDLYRGATGGFMTLRRQAGLTAAAAGPHEHVLERALGRMLHIDDPERVRTYADWLASDAPPDIDCMSEREQRLATMLHFDLWGRSSGPTNLRDSLARLWRHPAIVDELTQLLLELDRRSERLIIVGDHVHEPLAVHAVYSRDEVLAGLGDATAERPPTMREGIRWIERAQADVFFVTLRKSEERFSPTTMYRDFALSPSDFHWESQSTTAERSPTGQRYIHHRHRRSRILLFVRDTAPSPFVYLGPADYRGHRGERPMAITWHLEREMPADFFLQARAVG